MIFFYLKCTPYVPHMFGYPGLAWSLEGIFHLKMKLVIFLVIMFFFVICGKVHKISAQRKNFDFTGIPGSKCKLAER